MENPGFHSLQLSKKGIVVESYKKKEIEILTGKIEVNAKE